MQINSLLCGKILLISVLMISGVQSRRSIGKMFLISGLGGGGTVSTRGKISLPAVKVATGTGCANRERNVMQCFLLYVRFIVKFFWYVYNLAWALSRWVCF